jgi:5-methylcytosine-specific restriction endonuclease McrA
MTKEERRNKFELEHPDFLKEKKYDFKNDGYRKKHREYQRKRYKEKNPNAHSRILSNGLIFKPTKEEIRLKKNLWWKNFSQTEKGKEFIKNRNLKRRGKNGDLNSKQWQDIKEKYGYVCLKCFKKEPEIKLTIDHIKPISIGGDNSLDNIQPLCRSCNSSKGINQIDFIKKLCYI